MNLKSHFSNQEAIDLLSQKGIYPYDYMDSFKKCKETQLPSRESVYLCKAFDSVNRDALWRILGLRGVHQN